MPALKDVSQVTDWLESCTNHERQGAGKHKSGVFSLSPCRDLLAQLGNPQLHGNTIHVAGSDGKGSVAVMLTNLAMAAGYRTGTFTSPHLITVRERIAIDGHPVEEAQFLSTANVLYEAHAAMLAGGGASCTYFELTAILAWLIFRTRGVQRIVLETGLGGRLDATNLCQPTCCVITPIGLEHMDWLGDTLTAIAREKLGIIKAQVPWVAAPQDATLWELFQEYARNLDAPLTQINADGFTVYERQPSGTRFSCHEGDTFHSSLFLPLAGWHQLVNALTAIRAGRIWLAVKTDEAWQKIVQRGLSRTRWPARCQHIARNTGETTVVDCAHTRDALQALAVTLQDWYPAQPRRVIICASMRDKDPMAGLAEVARPGDAVISTQVSNPRCLPAQELANKLAGGLPGRDILPAESLDAALQTRCGMPADNLTVITGSCYLAGAFLEEISFPISFTAEGEPTDA